MAAFGDVNGLPLPGPTRLAIVVPLGPPGSNRPNDKTSRALVANLPGLSGARLRLGGGPSCQLRPARHSAGCPRPQQPTHLARPIATQPGEHPPQGLLRHMQARPAQRASAAGGLRPCDNRSCRPRRAEISTRRPVYSSRSFSSAGLPRSKFSPQNSKVPLTRCSVLWYTIQGTSTKPFFYTEDPHP